MQMNKETYKRYVDARAPKSPTLKNCLWAFLVGGLICCMGQGLILLYTAVCGLSREDAGTLEAATLVALSAILTGFGLFDRIAKRAGAGTLVPITGFANSVASPAIEFKTEGMIYGMAAKMFIVAGPIIVFGVLAGTAVGIIYLFL